MSTRKTALTLVILLCLPACADDDPAGPAPDGAPDGMADSGAADGGEGTHCSEDNVLQIRYRGPEDSVYDPDAFIEVRDGDTLKALQYAVGEEEHPDLYFNFQVSHWAERLHAEATLSRGGETIAWMPDARVYFMGTSSHDPCSFAASHSGRLLDPASVGEPVEVGSEELLGGPVDIEFVVRHPNTGLRYTTLLSGIELMRSN
jgi:hypothetical protein